MGGLSRLLRRKDEFLVRIDANAKLRGQQRFPTDYPRPDMLWVRLVRSSVPHARIRSIDTTGARSVPGVVNVFVAADIPGNRNFGLIIDDQPVLCNDYVRQVGDPVAVVVAQTEAVARLAADRVIVDFEVLPIISNIKEALGEGAIAAHVGGNVCAVVEFGAVDSEIAEAFSEAPIVVESEYRTPRQSHVFMEVEGGIAYMDGDTVTVVAGGQNPFKDRAQIAAVLGIDVDNVRVKNPPSGGAFGGKEDCSVQIPLALAAFLTKQPCRFVYDRSESLTAGVKRHPFEVRFRSAATADGRLMAIDVDFDADAGAYTTLSPGVIALAAEHVAGAYTVPLVRVRGRAVFTNNGNSSAFRGFGNPQVLVGLEQHLDIVAERVGVHPVEIRRRNLAAPEAAGLDGLVSVCAESVKAVLDVAEAWPLPSVGPERPAVERGVGYAFVVQGYGLGIGVETGAFVVAHVTEDGIIDIEVSAPDMGTGVHSSLAAIMSKEFGVPIDGIRVRSGDSASPDAGSSNASRSLFIIGNAVQTAAIELRNSVLLHASKILDISTELLTLEQGVIASATASISLAELVQVTDRISVEGGFAPNAERPMLMRGVPHFDYAAGMFRVVVDVDRLTGEVEIQEIRGVVDPGEPINEQAIRSQIEGGLAQGLGFALFEDAIYVEGVPQNTRLTTYIVPTATDIPYDTLSITLIYTRSTTNPLGVRGIAELGLGPMAPAIANAISNAIGVRFAEFPIRSEHILAALTGSSERSVL